MTGNDLKQARLKLGLSQRKLSEKLGVSWNTVARWERGEIAIGNPVILDLAMRQIVRLMRLERIRAHH